MSNVKTTAGSSLAVSAGSPATNDQAGFAALTWTTVGEITNFGEIGGREYTAVTHTPIDKRKTVTRKGTYDYPEFTLEIGRDATDAGQDTLKEARDSDNSYSFRLTRQDGSIIYLSAQVMSFINVVGESNTIAGYNVGVKQDDDEVDVPGIGTQYTVTYLAGTNGSIIGTSTQSVLSGGSTEEVYAAADATYVFVQWDDASTDNPRKDTNVTASATYTASFALA